ncbi:MAG: RimK family alpha-L-glutamate ligase [Sandaracinaceae bacterium]
MKVLILSRAAESYSTRRLREACRARGHRVRALDTLRFSMAVSRSRPELLYRDRPLSRYDAVLPRIGASITLYGTAVVRQFEQMGVFTLASSDAIRVSRDKLRCLQLLSRHNIGIPPTVFVRDRQSVRAAIERLGGAPVIVKVLEGTQGVGVILAETVEVAQAILETLHSARQNALIQRFVHESRGRDLRALVVGDRVVAAMRRRARGEEFRSIIHRGGRGEAVTLDAATTRTAVRAAQVMGLRVAGVDLIEARDGPQVLEINSSPGLEGIETVTGVDVAARIVELIEERFLLPEVDLKQRLTLGRRYGVAEFRVPRRSELAGRTLADLALDEREVRVLSLERAGLAIPNPRGDQRILAGDHLVCFGRIDALKGLIPRTRTGRRRRIHPDRPSAPGSADR